MPPRPAYTHSDRGARIERLAALLATMPRALVLTGAGMSAEAGLLDYRGVHGLWRERPVDEVASIDAWRNEPESFWDFYAELLASLAGVRPNAGHFALAELERLGLVEAVITENVDGLHVAAGSTTYEVEGSLAHVVCLGCGYRGPSGLARAQREAGRRVPVCPRCGEPLKPDVVLFGEPLTRAFDEARRRVEECELLLAAGTSLRAGPVTRLAQRVAELGRRLAIVNAGATDFDDRADLRIEGRAAEVLLLVVEALKGGRSLRVS